MSILDKTINFRYLKLFSCMVLIRLIYLCLVKTYFVPDEYWQSIEIAHKTVFGYGYVTWEWEKAIRSFFYPFWFSLTYAILAFFKLDNVEVLILLPRIIQSLLSSVADLYLWLWLNKPSLRLKKGQIYWTFSMWVMCLLINYCSTRTLTNTAELNFSTIAMYYYPWSVKRSYEPHFLWFVGLACLIRPTAVIQWIPLCVYDLCFVSKPFKYTFIKYLSITCKIVCLSVLIDFLFYKRFVLTPLNFILYNGQYNVGIHYGVHSWFWYILVGIPIVLGPLCILFYLSVFRMCKDIILQACNKFIGLNGIYFKKQSNIEIILLFTIVWTICWYSIVPHKEFRFILPLTPAMFYIAGIYVDFNQPKIKNNYAKRYFLVFISVCTIILNVVGLFYLGLWHQIGPTTVISKLSQIARANPSQSNFLFLTPCHATPLYSYLHVNVTTRFLTCEPNLLSEQFYKDESDVFFENPSNWLLDYALDKDYCSLPSHIIFYSNLKSSIEAFLNNYNYTMFDVIFNSHFVQGRQSHYIEIFHLIKTSNCSVRILN